MRWIKAIHKKVVQMGKQFKNCFSKPSIWQFHIAYVVPNLIVLSKLKQTDILVASMTGRIDLGGRWILVKNALFFGFPRKRLLKTIELTILTFCHEMKNPIERRAHRVVWEKTMHSAGAVISKLKDLKYPSELIMRLEEIVDGYYRASYLQAKMMAQITKGVQRSRSSSFWNETQLALEPEQSPKTPKRGASGAYFIHGKRKHIAGIFKPYDEEIGAPNNPTERHLRGILGSRTHGFGTSIGQGVHREVAAYHVDRSLRLNIVPRTCYAEFKHDCFYEQTQGELLQELKTKQGSFQEYYPGAMHLYQMRYQDVEEIPADQMHRLILLDLVIGNMDRNYSNVLTDGKRIVAIDHALSFSPAPVLFRFPLGVLWPQMSIPFFPSLKRRVECINVEKLCSVLKKQCFLDETSLQRMRERVAVLQQAVKQGLILRQMVQLMKSKQMIELKDLSLNLNKKAEEIVQQYAKNGLSHGN